MSEFVDADGCRVVAIPRRHPGPASRFERQVLPFWNPVSSWGCRLLDLTLGPHGVCGPGDMLPTEIEGDG